MGLERHVIPLEFRNLRQHANLLREPGLQPVERDGDNADKKDLYFHLLHTNRPPWTSMMLTPVDGMVHGVLKDLRDHDHNGDNRAHADRVGLKDSNMRVVTTVVAAL
jgi:hypothetical protein